MFACPRSLRANSIPFAGRPSSRTRDGPGRAPDRGADRSRLEVRFRPTDHHVLVVRAFELGFVQRAPGKADDSVVRTGVDAEHSLPQSLMLLSCCPGESACSGKILRIFWTSCPVAAIAAALIVAALHFACGCRPRGCCGPPLSSGTQSPLVRHAITAKFA